MQTHRKPRLVASILIDVLVQTLVRTVYGVCVAVILLSLGLYLDVNMTAPSTQSHWHLIEGPAQGQAWPSPLPLP